MSIRSLGYLGFAVKDAGAWDAFATGVLGLMPGENLGETRRYRLDDLDWRIAVERGSADDLAYVGFEVAGPVELDAVAARLAEGGVAVGNSDPARLAERGVLGLISCQDPDGLAVEVFYGPTLRRGGCTTSWSRRRAWTLSASPSNGRRERARRSPPASAGTPTIRWFRFMPARPRASRSSSASAPWRWTTPAGGSRVTRGRAVGATSASRADAIELAIGGGSRACFSRFECASGP
jgi:hypothetical protein